MWIVVAFGAGLWAGLAAFGAGGAWYAATPVLAAAAVLWRRAPLGGAIGVVGVAGILWGRAAVLERNATCAGAWGSGAWGVTRAATVRLRDPVGAAGGVVEGDLVGGPCGGRLAIRWLESRPARGGTRWVVAGRWLGGVERGVLVARRLLAVDREPAGRGALRDRIAARADTLFGARAALVQALVIARKTDLEASLRERYARAGLAHLLAISGLHVGFIAAWLLLLLKPVPLSVRVRLAACGVLLMGYLWLLGFPPPATRAVLMLVIHQIARLRQRVVAPAAVLGLAALGVMLADPWAVRSVGAWLSVAAVAGVVRATRAAARMHRLVRLVAPAVAATLATAPITALAFGTVAPIGVLANLVAIPLAGLAVPGLVAALVTAPVFPWLARL